jgi:hypothetical protein
MMPAAARHSKPRKPASKLGVSIVAAAALASVAAAFVYLNGVSGASQAADRPLNALAVGASHAATSGVTSDQLTVDYRKAIAHRMAVASIRARHRFMAAQAARRARLAAQRQAAQQAKQQATAQPSASPAPTLSSGSDPAHSALGVCIRNAEEGGSYAWGPGNGGGAYQFTIGTWEHYGGAASEFGVAGPSYQDQIFDNAINAGGASNWTAYDGC